MDMSPSKIKILEAALDLFSQQGYEATSVGQIADAVGIKKASLYSHFESKQEIFDVLMAMLNSIYDEKSIFKKVDWDDEASIGEDFDFKTAEDLVQNVKYQLQFICHEPHIKKTRKLLTIEQFQNQDLCALQEAHTYGDIMRYSEGMMKYLIRKGIFKDLGARTMALQYMAPISVELYRVDRNPALEKEALENIEKHIRLIFELFKA